MKRVRNFGRHYSSLLLKIFCAGREARDINQDNSVPVPDTVQITLYLGKKTNQIYDGYLIMAWNLAVEIAMPCEDFG